MRAYITGADVAKDGFKKDLVAALQDRSVETPFHGSRHERSPPPPNEETSDEVATAAAGSARPTSSTEQQPIIPTLSSSTPTPPPSDTSRGTPPVTEAVSNVGSSSTVTGLLAERRQRLEQQRRAREAAEKAERAAKAKARREAAEAQVTETAPDSKRAKEIKYAKDQRKRQQEARQERERILRLVEHDKAERKEREERRRALASAEAEEDATSDEQSVPEKVLGSSSAECAIQVRLVDGSTIRSRFPATATLRANVRPWVDGSRPDSDVPYTFKQILTPLPNRMLSISEEEESVRALGLMPSATLVLFPIRGATDAYGTAGQGLVSRGISTGYGLVWSGVGMVAGALGTFLGVGTPAPTQDDDGEDNVDPACQVNRGGASQAGSAGPRSNINVRTLRDQDGRRDDRQFYNGNQVGQYSLRVLLVDSRG